MGIESKASWIDLLLARLECAGAARNRPHAQVRRGAGALGVSCNPHFSQCTALATIGKGLGIAVELGANSAPVAGRLRHGERFENALHWAAWFEYLKLNHVPLAATGTNRRVDARDPQHQLLPSVIDRFQGLLVVYRGHAWGQ